jgi:hypothetical protein
VGAVTDAPRLRRQSAPAAFPRREFPNRQRFRVLRSGQVIAAWTSTAAPNLPDDAVVLSDRRR